MSWESRAPISVYSDFEALTSEHHEAISVGMYVQIEEGANLEGCPTLQALAEDGYVSFVGLGAAEQFLEKLKLIDLERNTFLANRRRKWDSSDVPPMKADEVCHICKEGMEKPNASVVGNMRPFPKGFRELVTERWGTEEPAAFEKFKAKLLQTTIIDSDGTCVQTDIHSVQEGRKPKPDDPVFEAYAKAIWDGEAKEEAKRRHFGRMMYTTVLNDDETFQSTRKEVFFGGDAAFGPENIITAVAHGDQAAVSIDHFCQGKSVTDRLPPFNNLVSQKMGIHEWSYQSRISHDVRQAVPHVDWQEAVKELTKEVELGFDEKLALEEAHRCLSCDVHTVFNEKTCIECSACEDICPTDCINFVEVEAEAPHAEEEQALAQLRIKELNPEQELLISDKLKTGHLMIKDEDVCLHCGLCAERCPTGAWDMKKLVIDNIGATIK